MMAGSVSLACAAGGGAVAWVVPTYRNARPVWRFVEQHATGCGDVARAERTVKFPGRGWLGVYTADNDVSMRGEAFDLVIVDEAAQVREETWTDVIIPTLADRDGRAMLISTPKGRNWFWREYTRGLADGKHQASFTAPSSANPMPSIRAAFELARTRVSSRTFRQEWLAEFVEEGGVFRTLSSCATAQPAEYDPTHQYVIGVDWGRMDDATVFTVIDTSARPMAVVHMDAMRETNYNLQRSRLLALWERYGHCAVVAEANSMGGPQIEALQAAGLPVQAFNTTNASKAQIIDAMALAFEQGTLAIPNDRELLSELEAYECERLPSGLLRYGAPDGMHDDRVMSLAIALYAASVYSGFGLGVG